MPRPADTYTHSQFELVDAASGGETVICIHCRTWTGNAKVLNRKKDHLSRCPAYAAWRAAGNGQDIPPQNKYSKRDSNGVTVWDRHDTSQFSAGGPQYTPTMARGRNLDLDRSVRTRCRYCGYQRTKNAIRQVEHLNVCADFRNSNDGQAALQHGNLQIRYGTSQSGEMFSSQSTGPAIFNATVANPFISSSTPRSTQQTRTNVPKAPVPARAQPSMTNHLTRKTPNLGRKAAQSDFLKHAGCGTLSAAALSSYLGQHGHVSRALVPCIGNLIGKVRLAPVRDRQQDPQYRTLDLLISAVSNVRKEIDFIEGTRTRYALPDDYSPPTPFTAAYIDLLASTSSPSATILQGIVTLWATEHYYCIAWDYARGFASAMPTSNTYSVPSYLTPNSTSRNGQARSFMSGGSYMGDNGSSDSHLAAIQETLIPNWTSPQFSKFVEACKAIVDELANAQTTGSGIEELTRCEQIFRQITWIWEHMWPDVTGMGELTELAEAAAAAAVVSSAIDGTANNTGNGSSAQKSTSNKDNAIHVDDDDEDADGAEDDLDGDEDEDADGSPYGGTGLAAVAAANQAS